MPGRRQFLKSIAASTIVAQLGATAASEARPTKTVSGSILPVPIRIYASKFGVSPNNRDNTKALLQAFNEASHQACELVLPAGKICHGDLGNIASQGLVLSSEIPGTSTLNALHSGVAFTFDGFDTNRVDTGEPPFLQAIAIDNIVFEGNGETTETLRLHGIARSRIDASIREANSTRGIGLRMQGCMSNEMRIRCSNDLVPMKSPPNVGVMIEDGSRQTLKPGVFQSTGHSSNNLFHAIHVDGVRVGLDIVGGSQNLFLSGAVQSCKEYGVIIRSECSRNTLVGFGMENLGAIADISDLGFSTILTNCYASNRAVLQGQFTSISGGDYEAIEIYPTAINSSIGNIRLGKWRSGKRGLIDRGKNTLVSRTITI